MHSSVGAGMSCSDIAQGIPMSDSGSGYDARSNNVHENRRLSRQKMWFRRVRGMCSPD